MLLLTLHFLKTRSLACLPASQERAQVSQWLEVESQNYNPAISALMAAKSSKGSAEPAVVEDLKAKVRFKYTVVYGTHIIHCLVRMLMMAKVSTGSYADDGTCD